MFMITSLQCKITVMSKLVSYATYGIILLVFNAKQELDNCMISDSLYHSKMTVKYE